ncbi:SDR family oxidoreductase [Pseudohoeflea suaedae]|uniref:SDR family oxidoreductase n=1 Tax=Pseudohoeflea suaedae TaxID=877384 RepID=A0A4R5PI83_9HYPH|nr:SDR family oxidoreductase [Pseudohoeflea suaedae]TDH34841.1 SDR family oxidoreductase [Pseudohoeflea suaedae]
MYDRSGQKVVLITGCSSGIGAHCARRLMQDGWKVIASARKPDDIAALRQAGIEAFELDYADTGSIASFFDRAMEATGGRCDALYNNGAVSQLGAVEDLSTDALRHQFEVNFFGYHELTRHVLPVMRKQGHGRIVHCSSILGRVPVRWSGAYNASKFALEGLALTQRMELEGSGIRVSLIEPGPIASNIATNALEYFLANVDQDTSPYGTEYVKRISILKGDAKSKRRKDGPETVYKALRHALTSQRPRAHYPVTTKAKLGILAQRLLPSGLLYKLLIRSQ